MVRMVLNEFARVFRDRITLCILLVLIFVNVFAVYINELSKADTNMCPPGIYRQIYDDISEMSDEEAYNYVKNKYETRMQGEMQGSYAETVSYGVVMEELRQCTEYDAYYDGIMETGKKRTGIAIFSGNNTYTDKNISRTVNDFMPLKGLRLQHGPSLGIKMLTSNMIINIIGITMLLVIAASLIAKDNETGMGRLIRTLKSGRMKLMCARICAMIMHSMMAAVVLFVPVFFISDMMYGYGNLSRSIQSLSGFMTTNMHISVMKFIVFFVLTKMIVFVLWGMLFVAVMCIFDSNVISFAVIAVITAVSAVMYYKIRDNSRFELLKNMNMYAYLDTVRLFSTYRNFKIFNEPVNYRSIFGISVVTAITVMFAVICASEKQIFKVHIDSRISAVKYGMVNLVNKTGIKRLFTNEVYKIFIYRKVAIILALCGFILVFTYKPVKNIYGSESDVYYKITLGDGIEGRYSEEKKQRAMMKLEQILSEENTAGNIDNYIKAYEKLNKNMEYAGCLQNGYVIYDRGYNLLTGQDMQKELLLFAECTLMTILAVFSIWSVEYAGNMDTLINSSYMGRSKVGHVKLVIALAAALAIFLGVHIPWIYSVIKAYGTDYINIPAANLQHLRYVPERISILECIIIRNTLKFVMLTAITLLIRLIARRTRSHMQTMVISTVLFVVPFLVIAVMEGIHT